MKNKNLKFKKTKINVVFKEGPDSLRKTEERIKNKTATLKDKEEYRKIVWTSRLAAENIKAFLEALRPLFEQIKGFESRTKDMWIKIEKQPGAMLVRVCIREKDEEALDWIIKRFNKLYRRYSTIRIQNGDPPEFLQNYNYQRYDFRAEIIMEVMKRGKDGKAKIKEYYGNLPINIFSNKALSRIRKYIKEENLRERNISYEGSGEFKELLEYESLGLPMDSEQSRKLKELKDNDKDIININGKDYCLINKLAKLSGESPQNIRNWGKQGLISPSQWYKDIAGYHYIDKTGVKKPLRVFPDEKLSEYLSQIRNVKDGTVSDRTKPEGLLSSQEVLTQLGISKSTLSWRCQKCKILPLKIKNRYYYYSSQFDILKKFKSKKH